MTAWPAHGVVIDSPPRPRRERHLHAVPDPDTLTDAARADAEHRYFTWCAEKGLDPNPEHGATTSEAAAMRQRFAAFLATRQPNGQR